MGKYISRKGMSRYVFNRMSDKEYISYLEDAVLELEYEVRQMKKEYGKQLNRQFSETQSFIGDALSAALHAGEETMGAIIDKLNNKENE